VERFNKAIRNPCPLTETQEMILQGEFDYFEKNKERMQYTKFRKQGLFIGSGMVEGGYG
jgi:hypothetical protein